MLEKKRKTNLRRNTYVSSAKITDPDTCIAWPTTNTTEWLMQIPLGSEKIHIQVLESIILWIQSYLKMDYVPGSRSSQ